MTEDQKVEDINMLKSLGNESDKINLTKRELRVIARKRVVKNYENHSKRELIKEIKQTKPFQNLSFEKILSEGYAKKYELGRKYIGFKKEKRKKVLNLNIKVKELLR